MSCVSIEKRCVPKDWQRLRNHTNGRYSNVLNTISRGFAALFIPRSTDFIPTLFQLIRPLPCFQTWCWFLHTWHLPWNLGKSMRWWWDPFEKKSGSSGSWGLGSGKTTWTDTAACKLQWHCANCTLVSNKNNGLSRCESVWVLIFSGIVDLRVSAFKDRCGTCKAPATPEFFSYYGAILTSQFSTDMVTLKERAAQKI